MALKEALKLEFCHYKQDCKKVEVQRLNSKSVSTVFRLRFVRGKGSYLESFNEKKWRDASDVGVTTESFSMGADVVCKRRRGISSCCGGGQRI